MASADRTEDTGRSMLRPVLFVGGTGAVGTAAIHWFRKRHPYIPLIIGARDASRAKSAASQVDGARAVVVDADRPALGLEDDLRVSAIVMLMPDRGTHGQRFAHDHSIPYLGIGDELIEIGPSAALLARRARTAAIVLGSHWAAGAGVFLALNTAARFERVFSVRIGALLDKDDLASHLALGARDRLDATARSTMGFEDDLMIWRDSSSSGALEAIDGRQVPTHPYAPLDVIGVRAETDAPEVRFDLATGVSSSRAAGGTPSAEIIVEVTGRAGGATTLVRSTLEFPEGQASLTGLVTALTVSAAMGLEGVPGPQPGLHFPETVAEPGWFLDELETAGAAITSTTRARP